MDTTIDFPKPLVAVVNGPALGIMFTILGLFDTIIASDTAKFTSPFTSLGVSPEGCSSYTFPRMFGYSLANDLLLFNHTMPVEQAARVGFVSSVVPADQLSEHVDQWLYGERGLIATCYPNSMINSKKSIRNEQERQWLHQVNHSEQQTLIQMYSSPERIEALAKFMNRKSKTKK